jgi:hypothetical protein
MLQGWAGHYRVSVAEQVYCVQDFWSKLGNPDEEFAVAIDLIRDAASILEDYSQAAQPDFDRWLLWGSLLAATETSSLPVYLATNSAPSLNWFANSLNDMVVGSLKALLEGVLENATTYQKEEMAIEIHLSITEFCVVVTKQFERGPPGE